MNNLNFRHEMSSDDGWHRIVETTNNIIGHWSLFESPAFLKIGDRSFSALTSYYGGVDKAYPPIETVFEMLTLHTEHGEAQREKNKPSSDYLGYPIVKE